MGKGADFEREICKKLSLWWTGGKRDDVFWRTSQSGGRATVRARKGLSTYGSYGDVAAIDPIGEPLLREWTIELKRGDTYGSPAELFDSPPSKVVRPWEKVLLQASEQALSAKSRGWMIIHKRDRKEPMVYLDWPSVKRHSVHMVVPFWGFRVCIPKDSGQWVVLYGATWLDTFLRAVNPQAVMDQE